MGLEFVELSMRFEDEFGIMLHDVDVDDLRTVSDLHALVLARIAARDRHRNLPLRVFRELREEVRQFLGDPKLRLRPRDQVVEIIPWTRRRALWRTLQQKFLSLQRYDLVRPAWLLWLIFASTVAALFATVVTAPLAPDWLPFNLLMTVLLPVPLMLATQPWRIVPMMHLERFSGIVRSEVGRTIATRPPPDDPIEVVDKILMDIVGASREKLVPTARLVEDLGMG